MNIESNLSLVQGHQGCKLTHICIYVACKFTRSMCEKCLKDDQRIMHRHKDWQYNYIECENFVQHFQYLRLPKIELRLQSQKGNQARLNYLKKIYENELCYFDDIHDLGCIQVYATGGVYVSLKQKQILEIIKDIIRDLINGYQNEMVQVKLFNETYQKLMKDGLFSLNDKELNILLDEQFIFVNEEIEYYNGMNLQLNQLDQYEEDGQSENQQKLRNIQKKLRRINDYLDIQQYSVEGKQFSFWNCFFFQIKDKYCAVDSYINNRIKLEIIKQKTLDVTGQLFVSNSCKNISFDPLMNYCLVQPKDKLDALFYSLKNHKQFKLIRKLLIKQSVREFYLSKNNIILVQDDQMLIKVINVKNELINQINLESHTLGTKKALFCYGSKGNMIAIEDKQVKVYSETKQQPFYTLNIGVDLQSMKFINDDQQLLTLDLQNCRIWQIDYYNFQLTQISSIRSYSYSADINELNFTFINRSGEIQTFDNKDNLWYIFSISGYYSMKITKSLIIIEGGSEIFICKRRSIDNYERLEHDY